MSKEQLVTLEESIEVIQQIEREMNRYFVRKAEILHLMVLAAISGEPMLLVGPPGTAKSDMAVKLLEALGFTSEEYFEYMLTRFTEPSEIFGPVDIEKLKDGRYIRRTEGMLPEARVIFLDEIFKANSAILNALLTVLNEKKFYQEGKPVPVKMDILFAATNEIPLISELDALKDRFVLKAQSLQVWSAPKTPQEGDELMLHLLNAGIGNEYYAYTNQKPWKGDACHIHLKVIRDKAFSLLHSETGEDPLLLIHRCISDSLLQRIWDILKTLTMEMPDSITVTDRKMIKLFKLMVMRALYQKRLRIQEEDVEVLLPGLADRDFSEIASRIKKMLYAG